MRGRGWEPWRPGLKLPLPGLPRVIAHRGASAAAPENTLAAFRAAKEQGAEMVELDARLTRDGVLVVIHDSTLDRTTDGRGRVALSDSDSIARLDAGSWFDPAFRGERLPTLVNTVQRCNPGGEPCVNLTTIFNASDRRRYEQELLEKTSKTPADALWELMAEGRRSVPAGTTSAHDDFYDENGLPV